MDVRGDVSQRWFQWAEARYSPNHTAIRVGYESALSALKRGATTEEVVIAADQAVNKLRPSTSDAQNPSDISASIDGKTHRGRVSGFQSRFESARVGRGSVLVWNFRLERNDAAGVSLNPIAIEMRGTEFNGAVANGDIVEVRGTYKKGKTLRIESLDNLTSQVTVRVRRGGKFSQVVSTLISIVVLIFIIAIFSFVFLGFAGFKEW